MTQSSRKIKWGILGTNQISSTIADAIRQSENSEILAIASRDLNKAIDFSKKHNTKRYYTKYSQLLTDPDIDVVYIGLPNQLHKEWIIRCAMAGKHILCEKPFVLTVQEAKEALDAVKKHNVFCMEALMYRFHPFIYHLEDLVHSKIIGDIQSIAAIYTVNIAALANQTAGGAIRSLGCYPLSLIRLLMQSEPETCVALGSIDLFDQNDRVSNAIFSFKNGVTATITTSDIINWWSQFTIFGTKGIIDINTNPWLPSQNNQITVKTDQKTKVLTFRGEKPLYTYQIDYVANQIQNKCFSPDASGITWEHSLGNVRLLDEWLAHIKNNSHRASNHNL